MISYHIENLQKVLVQNNDLATFHDCENVVKIKDRPMLIKEQVIAHTFSVAGAQQTKNWEIPILRDRPFSILQYGIKCLGYKGDTTLEPTIDPDGTNRFWIDPQNGNLKFGGRDGHEITAYAGKMITIKSPSIYFSKPKLVMSILPASGKTALVRFIMKIALLEEVN